MPASKANDANLTAALRRLRDSAAHLNSLTEDVAGTVAAVERFLDDCHIGIELSVPIGQHGDYAYKLVYTKIGNSWRIGVFSDTFDVPNRPWSDCPRDLKLWSVKHIPTLVRALDAAVVDRTTNARLALTDVSDALSGLIREGK